MRARLRDPATYALWKRRGGIIERLFGHIKEHDGFRRWTVSGLEAVRTQWTMLCATVNLRVIYRRWKTRRKGAAAAMAALWQVRHLDFLLTCRIGRTFSVNPRPMSHPAVP